MAPRRPALQKISANTPVTPRREVTALKAQIEKSDAEMKELKSQLAELTASNKDMTEKHSAEMAELTANLSKTNIVEQASVPVPSALGSHSANPFGGTIPVASKVVPKRPLGAFHYFSQAFREEAKASCESNSLAEVNSALKKMWDNASAQVRKEHEDKAAQDRDRYTVEMEEYQEEVEKIEVERAALESYFREKKQQEMEAFYNEHYAEFAAKQKKASEAAGQPKIEQPKQARSAYIFFNKMRREQLQDDEEKLPFDELNKQIGAEWAVIQKSRKKADKVVLQKCKTMAEEDRQRFFAEQEDWEKAKSEQAEREAAQLELVKQEALKLHAEKIQKDKEMQEFLAQKKEAEKNARIEKKKAREEKKSQKEAKAAMPKRPRSAYIFFSMEKRQTIVQEMNGASLPDVSRRIGAEWKALTAEDRAPYDEAASNDKARYEEEMKLYAEKK